MKIMKTNTADGSQQKEPCRISPEDSPKGPERVCSPQSSSARPPGGFAAFSSAPLFRCCSSQSSLLLALALSLLLILFSQIQMSGPGYIAFRRTKAAQTPSLVGTSSSSSVRTSG